MPHPPWRVLTLVLLALGLVTATEEQDCYSSYEGRHLVRLTLCTEAEIRETEAALEDGGCTDLSSDGVRSLRLPSLPAKRCSTFLAICSGAVASELGARIGSDGRTQLVSEDAAAHFRKVSGTAKPYRPDATSAPGAAKAASASVASDSADATAASATLLPSDVDFYADWRSLEDQEARIQALVDASRGVARLTTLGYSVENRSIKAVFLTGRGYRKGKPRLFFNFQIHAREWIAGMSGVYAVERMVTRAMQDAEWLAGMEIVLVPTSNPDGFQYTLSVERFWRKNRRLYDEQNCAGVDLNRNWPKDFGGLYSTSVDKCRDIYIGTGPLSEPESQALNVIIQGAPVTVHIDVHSFSEMILAPWSFTYDAHPRRKEIMDLGSKIQAAMASANGVKYQLGDNILYPASGVFSDWSTAEGALGYVIELRLADTGEGLQGFAPPASEILPTAKECLLGLFSAVEWSREEDANPQVQTWVTVGAVLLLVTLLLGAIIKLVDGRRAAMGGRALAPPIQMTSS